MTVTSDVRTGLGSFVDHRQHNTVATSSAMRFWARAIGERNPRYVDASAIRPLADGAFQAHPCWLYSVQDSVVSIGHQGLVPVVAGSSWTFGRPIAPGDVIRSAVRLVDEYETVGRHAGPTVVQVVEVDYESDRAERLATVRTTLFRISPEEARRLGKHAGWSRTRYTEEQLLEIETAYDAEDSRRRDVRQWDDVVPGDELDLIVRGPVTSEETTLFVGATHPVPGVETFTQDRLAGRVDGFVHPRTGTWETYAARCVDDVTAQQLGFPAAHDLGIDRISYTASMVTSWMGPRGRLLRFGLDLLEPAFLGDTTWCSGRVVGLRRVDDDPVLGLVDIEVETTNQRGILTGRGSATVALDSRPTGVGRRVSS